MIDCDCERPGRLRRLKCRLGFHRWEPVRDHSERGRPIVGRVCAVNGCRAWRSWWQRYNRWPYLHVGLIVSLAANALCLVTLGLLVRTLPGRSANSPSPESAPPPSLRSPRVPEKTSPRSEKVRLRRL